MIHRKLIPLTVVSAVFLSACTAPSTPKRIFNEENFLQIMSGFPDSFTYEKIEYIGDYDIGDDGTLYALLRFPEPDGSVRSELHSFSPDGEEISDMGEVHAATVLWNDGKLYLTAAGQSDYYFAAYDLESGELTRLADAEIVPENTILIGDTIYYTGVTEERRGMREYISGTDFEYNGTQLYKYKIGGSTADCVDVEYPVSITETAAGELCVYAADENGTYFMIGENGKKNYNDLGEIGSFGFLNENNLVFSSNLNPISLNMGRLNSSSIYSELVENAGADRIKVRSGYAYYISGFTRKLERINCAAYDKQNEIIRFLSPEYTFGQPFSIGYMTDYKELDDERFSLSVLSQDSNFDICMLNSGDGYAANIREKGSFYPLNDIPNVREYLDKCFPYLKEAATDAEGNIWMLPISVSLPVIVYNKNACADAKINISGVSNAEELIAQCEKAYDSDYKNGYDIHPYQLTKNLLMQYMAAHDSFDNSELRAFAEFTEEKINLSEYPPYLPIINEAMNNLYKQDGEKDVLFSYITDIDRVKWLSDYDGFDFCAVPGITENAKAVAACTFISVNPSSSNLEAALAYVSDLAEYLGERENSFILADRSSYADNDGISSVYDIVSEAEVGFNVSEEVYFELFVKYHSGEITLDEFIDEADRRLSAYLNE